LDVTSAAITLDMLRAASSAEFPPFFYTPHIDHPIVCLPTCRSADNHPNIRRSPMASTGYGGQHQLRR